MTKNHAKCPICNKELQMWKYNAADYAYKVGNKYFCGYNCYNKALKALEVKEKAKITAISS